MKSYIFFFIFQPSNSIFLIFVVPSIMLYSSEVSSTRCNNCVFILRNGFTLHVSGDNLTHHQEYICCIWPQVSMMLGTTNIKFIDAQQAKLAYQYKNTKRKLYKTNAAIWYSMMLGTTNIKKGYTTVPRHFEVCC